MRRLLFFLLFLGGLSAGVVFNQANRPREVFRSICDLTETHFYKESPALESWIQGCHFKASRLPAFLETEKLVRLIGEHMSSLEVSHFSVYSPEEDKKLWKGEAVDTGIRARFVEEHLIVYKVFAESAAARAGVRAGDEILTIEGTEQVTPWGAQNRAGKFTLLRGADTLIVEITPVEINISSAPELRELRSGVAQLEISSFRSEFFDSEEWRKLVSKFSSYRHIILDIRENSGGNFVAMLRALSPFMCEPTDVGRLVQPRKKLPALEEMPDNTEDGDQIELLGEYGEIKLHTFPNYGCFRGKVTVLIGPETSSVSEIFAASFFRRPNSRVWGQPTAGEVVLAVWYELRALGMGYSVSIPQAVYLTSDGVELEARGVAPQREIFYDLALSRRGLDTMIERALQ